MGKASALTQYYRVTSRACCGWRAIAHARRLLPLDRERAAHFEHIIAEEAPVAVRDIDDADARTAPQPRLPIGVAAAHWRQMREGHLPAGPHHLIGVWHLDLELHDPAGRVRIEGSLEANSERG